MDGRSASRIQSRSVSLNHGLTEGLRTKSGTRLEGGLRTETRTQGWIPKQSSQRGRKGGRIMRRYNQARVLVVDYLRQASDPGHDYGPPKRHRLCDRHAERLERDGRLHHNIHGAKPGLHIGLEADKFNPPTQWMGVGKPVQTFHIDLLVLQRSRANKPEPCCRKSIGQESCGL